MAGGGVAGDGGAVDVGDDPHRLGRVNASPTSAPASPDMRRFALRIHYDGRPWHGWQLQPGVPTVQGELERVLLEITGRRRVVLGSGRTDSGVHATGQVARVDLPSRWEALELRRALNALLDPTVWVQEVRRVPPDFHPRFHAVQREYLYRVVTGPGGGSPFLRPFAWGVEVRDTEPRPVDEALLHQAASLLPGRLSFRRFARSGQPERGEICTIREARWSRPSPGSDELRFHIAADRFLHHMVRYLVGTMMTVARGERPLEEMAELLANPDTPLRTSPPAPPQGLYLAEVTYPPERWGDHPDRDPPTSRTPSP